MTGVVAVAVILGLVALALLTTFLVLAWRVLLALASLKRGR
jgi:hypothetical protein